MTEHELLTTGTGRAMTMLSSSFTLRLRRGLGRFVRRLIGDGQEAEDVVQDTLLALYLNLNRIEPVEKLRPYVFRIARNRCYDILRRGGRYEEVSIDDDEDDPFGCGCRSRSPTSARRRRKKSRTGCCCRSKCARRWTACPNSSARR